MSLLLAAMAADAADEFSGICHFCDSEDMDVSQLSLRVVGFIARMTVLFGSAPSCVKSGYTRHVIDTLRRATLVWPDGKTLRHLGAVTSADMGWAFGHTASFLRLLLAGVEAEFPDWEVTQAFRVFDVRANC